MADKDRKGQTDSGTYTIKSGVASKAAEEMARARKGNTEARAEYSRVLVEESKSFGAYVSKKIGARLREAS